MALLSILLAFTVAALLNKFVFSDVSLFAVDLDADCEAVSVLEQ